MKLLLLALGQDTTGLARGRYPAPSWVIWLVSAIVVGGVTIFLVSRAIRARRGGRP